MGSAIGVTWALHHSQNMMRDYIDAKQREMREEVKDVANTLHNDVAHRADIFQTILDGMRLDIHGVSMYARENIGRLSALVSRVNGNGK